MRRSANAARDFEARVITGTHTILMAINCPDSRRKGLLGFGFKRDGGTGLKFLRSVKVFESIVPDPKNAKGPDGKPARFYTDTFPVQSFLWGDYSASPGTKYKFSILPMYGKPGTLTTDARDQIDIEVSTEKEWEPGEVHGVWFNRGAIAGQKFAEEFGNKAPANINDPDDPEVKWLS